MTTMANHLTALPSTTTVDEIVDVIHRDGGVIVEDFLDTPQLDELRAQLGPVLESTGYGEDEFFAGTQTRRAGGLFGRIDLMPEIALHPLYYGAAKKILQVPLSVWVGDDQIEITPDIQIGVTQAIEIHPGQGAQRLHRDDTSFLWRHPDLRTRGPTADHGGGQRFHSRKRRHPRHTRKPSVGRPTRPETSRSGADRNAGRCCPHLDRFYVPRRW